MLVIDADMLVQGQITLLGPVRIEGRLEGSLVCTSIEVGRFALVEGTLVAESIVIAGQLVGAGWARRIHLAGTAIVEGELYQEQLSMDEHSTLVGESRRQARFDMPPHYLALVARQQQAEQELHDLTAASRQRHEDEADRARADFQRLRARFPGPRRAAE